MAAIINILQGPKGKRSLEGVAEIYSVIDYEGEGWYLIDCIFQNDPTREVCRREWNIDEPGALNQPLLYVENTPPLPADVLTVLKGAFQTLQGGKHK